MYFHFVLPCLFYEVAVKEQLDLMVNMIFKSRMV
jgi:hypothetical protein